jgi:parallel beta-helix repeat protein
VAVVVGAFSTPSDGAREKEIDMLRAVRSPLTWLGPALLIAMVLLLARAEHAGASGYGNADVIYFVRKTGNDLNDGRSPAAAFRTITKAAAVVQPGGRVYVGAGEYMEGDIAPASRGLAGKPITFIADIDGAQTGDAGQVVVIAYGFSNGFLLNNRPWVTVNGFIVGYADVGIAVKGGSHFVQITNNVVLGNGIYGIYVQDSSDVRVMNNLVYFNETDGIRVGGAFRGSQNAALWNNTVYGNGGNGMTIGSIALGATHSLVYNNILFRNEGVGMKISRSSFLNFLADYNLNNGGLYYPDTPWGANNIVADPLFLNPDLGDFRLKQDWNAGCPTGCSPAYNAGYKLAKEIGLDSLTTKQPANYDISVVDMGYHQPW